MLINLNTLTPAPLPRVGEGKCHPSPLAQAKERGKPLQARERGKPLQARERRVCSQLNGRVTWEHQD
jgi:hypothetical protein